jgi:hypothetical protein
MVFSVLGRLESTRLRVPSAADECVMSRCTKRKIVLSGDVAENLMVSACQSQHMTFTMIAADLQRERMLTLQRIGEQKLHFCL